MSMGILYSRAMRVTVLMSLCMSSMVNPELKVPDRTNLGNFSSVV
jgi:hypothetical protein